MSFAKTPAALRSSYDACYSNSLVNEGPVMKKER